ncbi:MAG: WD40 repeat domain-containing protein [Anaerolineae bacterium]
MIRRDNVDQLAPSETLDPPGPGIGSIAWSADSTRLAIASDNGTIAIWDMTTLEELRASDPEGGIPAAMVWSPDKRSLAAVSGDEVLVYDPGRLTVSFRLQGPTDNGIRIAWSPDNRYIAAGWFNSPAVVWSPLSRNPLYTVGEGNDAPDTGVSVDFSPDSRILAVGSVDGIVTLVDATTGELLRLLDGHSAEVRDLSFSPSGASLASAALDGEIIIWDPATGDIRVSLDDGDAEVYDVVWTPDEQLLATGDSDGIVRIWSTGDGSLLREIVADPTGGSINDLAWGPDGMELAIATGANVTIWRVDYGSAPAEPEEETEPEPTPEG